jgi:hypothetical protein
VGYIAFFAAFFHPVRPHKHKLYLMNKLANLYIISDKIELRGNAKNLITEIHDFLADLGGAFSEYTDVKIHFIPSGSKFIPLIPVLRAPLTAKEELGILSSISIKVVENARTLTLMYDLSIKHIFIFCVILSLIPILISPFLNWILVLLLFVFSILASWVLMYPLVRIGVKERFLKEIQERIS